MSVGILDLGSYAFRIGISTSEAPVRQIQPSVVQNGKVCEAYTQGEVQSWESLEQIFNNILPTIGIDNKNNKVDSLVVADSILTPTQDRDRMCELLFEKFGLQKLFYLPQEMSTLIASGVETGVLVHHGHTTTSVLPIYKGRFLKHAGTRAPYGSNDVMRYLSLHLQKQKANKFNIRRQNDKRIATSIKQKYLQVATGNQARSKFLFKKKKISVQKRNFLLTSAARFTSEIPFNPNLAGVNWDGVHKLVYNSISKSCPVSASKLFLQNILLEGGGTLMKGFPERLSSELKYSLGNSEISPKITKVQKTVWNSTAKSAELIEQQNRWITKEDWLENHQQLIKEKCF
ncbi:actin [Anaeramoeba flamelloides]|uniref:Actin n=1 Tax=Anaeramoeba flamelloides TaxID=1746091 RepID=A0AAV7Z0B0_9EUKA|nr:actin [Anaeramoeba flamelloides]KAJ6241579.1 actin [Anaeramoeba flamelloides]